MSRSWRPPPGGRRMGACETTPPTLRAGETSQRPPHTPTRRRLFLASDHRPPLAGLKLVRPRPRLPARRCGRSSLTPARATAQTGSDEEKPQPQSHPQPRRQDEQVTGSVQHALLTTGAPMGAETLLMASVCMRCCESAGPGGRGLCAGPRADSCTDSDRVPAGADGAHNRSLSRTVTAIGYWRLHRERLRSAD